MRCPINRTTCTLILGLISLGLALWGGMHLQHLIDGKGNCYRHIGETVALLVLALLVFLTHLGMLVRRSPRE